MKVIRHFIRWLAKVFKADITTVKTVTKVETRYLPPEGGVIQGNLYVQGSIYSTGFLSAKGDIVCKASCHRKEEENGTE